MTPTGYIKGSELTVVTTLDDADYIILVKDGATQIIEKSDLLDPAYSHTNSTALAAVSGTNTGDETQDTIVSKLDTALDSRYYTETETTSLIASAVAGLVNSSPSTLDTLKELADALGDDPNFATTIATSIGGKLAKSSNLSDLASLSTALVNLGLNNVNNTSDASKPVSTAQAAAIALKSNKAGDTFTGMIQFSGTNHAGIKLNSLTTTQRDALTPAEGMIIYNSTVPQLQQYLSGTWQALGTGSGSGSGTIEIQKEEITAGSRSKINVTGTGLNATDNPTFSRIDLELDINQALSAGLINDMYDVDIDSGTLADGQALVYDLASDTWVNGSVVGTGGGSLATLTDTDIVTPQNGDSIFYNSGSSKWENTIPSSVLSFLSGEPFEFLF